MKISQAIEQYLVAKNLKEESSKERKYYVSDMGKCQRIRYIKRKGVSTELSPHVYWIFEQGNNIHDFVYSALRAQSLLLDTEQTLETEHFVGRYDGKVKNETVSKTLPSLFDAKSTAPYGMKKAMSGADNEENIRQILTYVMLELEKNPKSIAPAGTIVYVNKQPDNTLPTIAYDREYYLDTQFAKSLKAEMDMMIDYWIEDKIPDCTCPSWMTAYNSYLPFCRMTQKEVRKHLDLIKKGNKLITTKSALFAYPEGQLDMRKEIFKI